VYRQSGEGVHVGPVTPTLKAPGTRCLNLEYDEPLSSHAFNFNLRRYRAVLNVAMSAIQLQLDARDFQVRPVTSDLIFLILLNLPLSDF